jgi:hypothetical protein
VAPLPYKSAARAEEWLLAHLQAYVYFQYLVNLEIDKVLANPTSTDPKDLEPDQWELYYLAKDPGENINLVSWRNGEPVPESGRIPESWSLTEREVVAELDRLRKELAAAMARVGYAPNGGPANRQERPALQRFARHNFNAP